MNNVPKLRVARPTNDLDELIRFYQDGLGLRVLGRFEDHGGFDGVILGHEQAPYHLEFTRAHGHTAGRAPSPDHLLVYYLPDRSVWDAAVERLKGLGHEPVRSFNRYWDAHGISFEDPDGYRIVLCRTEWSG